MHREPARTLPLCAPSRGQPYLRLSDQRSLVSTTLGPSSSNPTGARIKPAPRALPDSPIFSTQPPVRRTSRLSGWRRAGPLSPFVSRHVVARHHVVSTSLGAGTPEKVADAFPVVDLDVQSS